MKSCPVLAVAFSLVLAVVAGAAPNKEAMSRLLGAKSLKCEFGAGANAEWVAGVLKPGSGRFGAPGPQSTIYYDGIDLGSRKARVTGAAGSSDLAVLPSAIGITLVEQVTRGGVAVTTIYGSSDAKGSFTAVMSKHVDVSGPFPQQYYGSCIVWQ